MYNVMDFNVMQKIFSKIFKKGKKRFEILFIIYIL